MHVIMQSWSTHNFNIFSNTNKSARSSHTPEISRPSNVQQLPSPLTDLADHNSRSNSTPMTPGSESEKQQQRTSSAPIQNTINPSISSPHNSNPEPVNIKSSSTTSTASSHWKRLKTRLKSTPNQNQIDQNNGNYRAGIVSDEGESSLPSYRKKVSSQKNSVNQKQQHGNVIQSGSTFGNSISDCPMSKHDRHVPAVVELCCECIELRALAQPGIYRIPGNDAAKKRLIKEINKNGLPKNAINDERYKEPNLMASLLKEYFRNLKDPIFTIQFYDEFMHTAREEDNKIRLLKIKQTIAALPAVNIATLGYLTHHLKRVADNSDKNKMTVKNLAMMFGPTLFISKNSPHQKFVADINHQWKILSGIINHVEYFFGPDVKTANDKNKTQEELDYVSDPPNRIEMLAASRQEPLKDQSAKNYNYRQNISSVATTPNSTAGLSSNTVSFVEISWWLKKDCFWANICVSTRYETKYFSNNLPHFVDHFYHFNATLHS